MRARVSSLWARTPQHFQHLCLLLLLLRFIQIVKKRIESLIEREYIERARGDHRLYNYLA